jgi:hypothetical protein
MKTGWAWYEESDYPRILQIMEDADRLPATYARWREKAETAERELKGRGHEVVRAMISPDTFPAWCRSHGKKVDAQARILFASYVAAGKA